MYPTLKPLLAIFAVVPWVSAQNTGSWGELVQFPVIPVAAYVVPAYPRSERLLMFSAFGKDTFSGARGKTQFGDFNYRTGAVSQREVANTNHDMFCPGMSLLQDGKLVITGGSDASVVSIYDPATNGFTRAPNMRKARGYQSSTTLSNGNVFTIGGSYSGGYGTPDNRKNGEIYNPSTNTWTLLNGAAVDRMLTVDKEGIWREDNHPWLFGWKNGYVFQAGPSKAMNWYGTANTGSVQGAGTRDSIGDAMCGVNVMFDAVNGKIFSAGGAQNYDRTQANARAHIITIGEPNTAAQVERVSDMSAPRGFSNAVVLPDGKVLITGGQRFVRVFTDSDAVRSAELFDPVTKTFAVLSQEIKARNYHAVSILLPDGRVLSAGGGMCYVGNGVPAENRNCNRAVDHLDGQIFTPPYLLRDGQPAPRPDITAVRTATSTAGTSIRIGGNMTVTLDGSAEDVSFSLMRLGSVTHSINSDQRRVPLTVGSRNGTDATITIPNDSGIVLPGSYYLFALKDGVPSIAWTMLVRL